MEPEQDRVARARPTVRGNPEVAWLLAACHSGGRWILPRPQRARDHWLQARQVGSSLDISPAECTLRPANAMGTWRARDDTTYRFPLALFLR